MINIIAAMSKNRVIGKNGEIPWHIPEDFHHFREVTINHPVVMGRKTFESIGKPLANRTNIILTRNKNFQSDGCLVYSSIDEIINNYKDEKVMIIGGQEIYNQFMPYADVIYLTYVDQYFEGDAYFPEFEGENWLKVSEQKGIKNENNPYDYYFQIYKRKEY